MTPLTRKENYLNEIVGWGETAPEKPLTPEEFFFAAILGEAVQTPEPLSRYQIYLAKIAGRNISVPKPLTRLELFLAKACGMDIETPTPITREEIFWSNYSAIVDFEVEGVPPLTYKAIEGTLENYRIYGNTVDGESVGDRTGNLFDGYAEIGSFDWQGADVNNKDALSMCRTGYINVLPDTTYTISLNGDYVIRHVGYYGEKFTFIGSLSVSVCTFTTPPATNQIRIVFKTVSGDNANLDDFTNIPTMLNTGSTALPYEPYGYKVPITVTNSGTTSNETIYLPKSIKMVGDEAEYIDYAEQKMHRIGADDINVTLPALPTLTGTNVLSVGTAVQPSKVYVKYKGERQ